MAERRTWNDGWRCDECCNGDRCDDASHYDRRNCPHCKGTGSAIWNMYSKEREFRALQEEVTRLRAKREDGKRNDDGQVTGHARLSGAQMKELIAWIDKLYAEATQGDWSANGHHVDAGETLAELAYMVCKRTRTKSNAALIAALHNAWPQIRDALEAMSGDAERLDHLESHCEWHIATDYEEGHITLDSVDGNVNDREYNERGRGATVREAIDSARKVER